MRKNKEFVRQLMYFVFDKADCLVTYNSFQKECKLLGAYLRALVKELRENFAAVITLELQHCTASCHASPARDSMQRCSTS
jgi:hypothetical protein